ncbi:hypothetical protein CR513_08271, partial [Mucuna pruriens]
MDKPKQKEGWTMFLDDASNTLGYGISAVLISPKDQCYPFTTRLGFNYTNNMDEYKACAMGLILALEYQAKALKVYGDLALVVHQLQGERETYDPKLIPYHSYIKELMENLESITFHHIPREDNQMTKASSSDPLHELDPEIEITLRRLRKARNIAVSNSSNSVPSSPVTNNYDSFECSNTNHFAEPE